jgi:A-factor biosynthesis hotdog protein
MTTSYDIKGELDTNLAPQIAPVSPPSRTIDKRLVHKSYDENVLLSHIEAVRNSSEPEKVDKLRTSILRIASKLRTSIPAIAMRARNLSTIFQRATGRTDHFRGILCVHRGHTFFFEHERAHVPGIYLIEAARQMSIAAAHMFYEVPFDVYEFVMTECSARFRNVANIDDPLIAEQTLSRHVYRKGRLVSMYGVVVIRQGHLEIASLSGSIVLLSRNQLKYLEGRGDKA